MNADVVEKALRESLTAHDAAIVMDPAKGYHFGTDPELPEIAKSIAARLSLPALDRYREALQSVTEDDGRGDILHGGWQHRKTMARDCMVCAALSTLSSDPRSALGSGDGAQSGGSLLSLTDESVKLAATPQPTAAPREMALRRADIVFERPYSDRKKPYARWIVDLATEADGDLHAYGCMAINENDPDACDCVLRYYLERAAEAVLNQIGEPTPTFLASPAASAEPRDETELKTRPIDPQELARALRDVGWPDFGSVRGSSVRHAELILESIADSRRGGRWPVEPAPAASAEPRDDVAWLIERGQPERHAPTVWWDGEGWTQDALKARRFADRAATEAAIHDHSHPLARPHGLHDPFGRATEHVFIAASAEPAGADTELCPTCGQPNDAHPKADGR